MTALLDRLNRWAENLPSTESIPISDAEALELADYAETVATFRKSNFLYAERVANLFDDILAGKFTFAGHRVVVL